MSSQGARSTASRALKSADRLSAEQDPLSDHRSALLRAHFPLSFEYSGNSVVPTFVKDRTGAPYTGRASGSISVADWAGTFHNGLPHGEFKIVWGDRYSGSVGFENGLEMDPSKMEASPKEEGQAGESPLAE